MEGSCEWDPYFFFLTTRHHTHQRTPVSEKPEAQRTRGKGRHRIPGGVDAVLGYAVSIALGEHRGRVYDEAVLDLLRAIQVAKAAGFSVKELRILFQGFAKGASLSRMWKALARKKLIALKELSERVTAMKDVLRAGLECDCLTPSDFRILSRSRISTERDRP